MSADRLEFFVQESIYFRIKLWTKTEGGASRSRLLVQHLDRAHLFMPRILFYFLLLFFIVVEAQRIFDLLKGESTAFLACFNFFQALQALNLIRFCFNPFDTSFQVFYRI